MQKIKNILTKKILFLSLFVYLILFLAFPTDILSELKKEDTPNYIQKEENKRKESKAFLYFLAGTLVGGATVLLLIWGIEKKKSEKYEVGSIDVKSTPTGARIFLDSQDTKRTTNTILHDVKVGPHTLTLKLLGYDDFTTNIMVYKGQITEIEHNFFLTIFKFHTKWGAPGSGNGEFYHPTGIALDSHGYYVYVADTGNNRIQKFTIDGTFVCKWGSSGSGNGQFNAPTGIAVDKLGYVYVVDSGNNRIQKFSSDGIFIKKWGDLGKGDGEFNYPRDIAVDDIGYVYVVDYGNNRIQKFDSEGTFITKWGSYGCGDGQFDQPSGIAVDCSSYIYVADANNHRIQKFTTDGIFVRKWGFFGSKDGNLYLPLGVAIDRHSYVYVADSGNHRIQKFDPNGKFIGKWGSLGNGNGQFNYPTDITANKLLSKIFVVEYYNNRVQVFGI